MPTLFLSTNQTPRRDEVVQSLLVQFNVARAGLHEARPLALLITEHSNGDVVGGLWGRTYWKWLFIELLFVPAALRGSGIGSSLMQQAEAEAIRRGCIGVWLDTFSYQAPDFYQRLGYTVFGRFDEYPPGHARIFLQKRLSLLAGS